MSTEALKTLRAVLDAPPPIEEGTVVRFNIQFDLAKPGPGFTYTAIFIQDYWLTTTANLSRLQNGAFIRSKMPPSAFENLLRSPQVSEIAVATKWETL